MGSSIAGSGQLHSCLMRLHWQLPMGGYTETSCQSPLLMPSTQVYKALRQGVQPVAVKKITQADEWQMTQFIKVRCLTYMAVLGHTHVVCIVLWAC